MREKHPFLRPFSKALQWAAVAQMQGTHLLPRPFGELLQPIGEGSEPFFLLLPAPGLPVRVTLACTCGALGPDSVQALI